ncbi:hypothetical protein [Profundibacter sp.]
MKKSIVITFLASLWATVVIAQNAETAIDIQQKIDAIVTEAVNAAPKIEDELFAILPTPQGWTCQRQDLREQNSQWSMRLTCAPSIFQFDVESLGLN